MIVLKFLPASRACKFKKLPAQNQKLPTPGLWAGTTTNNNNWIYIAHFPLDQSTVAYYYYPVRKSWQSLRFTFTAGQAHNLFTLWL